MMCLIRRTAISKNIIKETSYDRRKIHTDASEIISMTVDDYENFLSQRRKVMARMIEMFYKKL